MTLDFLRKVNTEYSFQHSLFCQSSYLDLLPKSKYRHERKHVYLLNTSNESHCCCFRKLMNGRVLRRVSAVTSGVWPDVCLPWRHDGFWACAYHDVTTAPRNGSTWLVVPEISWQSHHVNNREWKSNASDNTYFIKKTCREAPISACGSRIEGRKQR